MKKIETRQKIIGGSQKACWELGRYGPKFRHQAKDWTMLRELSGSSLGIREEIGKLARNIPRDHQRKTMRLTAGDFGGCRSAGWVNHPYQDFELLSRPVRRVNRSYLDFSGIFEF
ncbi:hypothetical protein BHM03_00030818 [Ensete ventricosum]|nr:hypothetical protein BHM03_00030818 [Ensete ventricosum]